jgi:sorbitol/mannitol transport system permease protein
MPPKVLFSPTLSEYQKALADFWTPLLHSVIIVGVSTIISLGLGVPAAFALSYYESKRNDGVLFWFITTKALPQAAVLIPLFIIFRQLSLLDTVWVLIIAFIGLNTPIVVWMMRQFMRDIPRGVLEAAEVDGVTLSGMLLKIVVPLTRAGIAATAMLCIVFAWNEFLFSLSFTATSWNPLSVAVSAEQTSRGQYWAQLSAFTSLAIIVPVIVGWFTQKQLVRGLTAGAEK